MASRILKLAGYSIAIGAVAALLVAERTRPLRAQTRRPLPRMARNAAMGAACQAVIMASEAPLTEAMARRNVAARRGLQHTIGGPAGRIVAFLAMDYGFYLWHVATHRVPFLWRFHRVHHVDPDLDASTAVRFHFLDMLLSLPWRLVQVRVSGVGPRELGAWRGFFLASILFHHANLRLPARWDQRLSRLFTTPRMHGIHHSQRPDEMDSNFSSGISIWDRLHATYRDDVAQQDIDIGIDDPQAARDERIGPALLAPFR